MRIIKSKALSLIVGLVFLCGAPSVYAQLVSSTGETLVNTTTTDSTQQNCAISMDTLGRYVVVWESEHEDGDGFGIYAKIYNADHSVRVSDFQINTNSDADVNDQRFPDVAMNADGTWCVTWQSQEDEGWSTSWMEWRDQGWDIYRRIYDIDGSAVNSQSRVNSSTAGNQMHPAIAAGDDFFVVTYASEIVGNNESEIYGRPFMSNGANVNSPQLIHSVSGSHMMHPDVAMTPTNEYTFTWQVDGLDGDRNGIYYASYDNSYNEIVAPTQVNTTTVGNQQEPRIAVDENGEFMIIWSSFEQDGDHHGIYGQRYTAPGTASGGEIAITTTTNGSQDHAAIAVSREGGKYVMTWTNHVANGGALGVYGRSMYYNGSFLDDDALINTTTSDYQNFSDVAIGTDTTHAVYAWQSGLRHASTSQTDPSFYGIYSEGMVVEDITPPVALCQNITVYLDGTGNVTITAADIDGGSTDNIGIVSMIAGTTAFDCSDIGLNTSSLTVYDAEGLSDNCVAAVIVEDTISPTAVCQNITVYLDGAGAAIWSAADIDGGSTDNCNVILTADITSATCAEVGANTVTLTVTDDSGNSSSCTSTVTVMDTVTPSAVCQNITVYLDGTGNATIAGADLDGGSTDNCSGTLTYSADITSFTCAEIGANTVTMTVTDLGGNSSNCAATVTILDTISPTAVCQNITVYLNGSGSASITATDVDGGSTDNCSVALSIDVIGFTCTNLGTNSVVLTATDPSGNTNTCTSTVTVLDTISPTVSCADIWLNLDANGSASIIPGNIVVGSTGSDNCATPTLSLDISTFDCTMLGANLVTVTATDASGNTSSCTSTITIYDITDPTAVCQDLTVYLDGTGNASITPADIDNGSTDNCSVALSADITSFTCSDIGSNTVALTAADPSGNTSSCNSTVTILDTISPVTVCQNITVYLDGTGNATITSADVDGGSSDNCGAPTLAIDLSAFDCSMEGTNAVTLTATDASGNTSSCTSTVTVLDTITPTVVCQDITVYLDGAGTATITAADIDGGSSDNCTLTLSADVTSFLCANIGPNSVTLTGSDDSGNSSSCTAVVTIMDTISPIVVCQDVTVYLDALGNGIIPVTSVDAGSSDNCGTTSINLDYTAVDCSNLGPNTVVLTVVDASGNTSTCSSTVTVLDTISPVALCQDITVYLDGTGNVSIIGSDVDGGSTDNCGAPTMSIDVSAFDCSMTGANTVTITATDASGNTNVCTSTVTVLDTITPTVVCQDITAYLDGTGNTTITAADVDGGSSDNCTPTLSIDNSTFDCSAIGPNLVTLTLTDPSGNTASCVATVTIADTLAPLADTLIPVNVECIGDVPVDINVITGVSDNCTSPSTVTWTSDVSDGLTCPETITRTYNVADDNGNSLDVVQIIIVQDLTAPTASNPLSLNVQCIGEVPAPVTGWVTDEADNCGAPIVTWTSDVSDGLSCPETITRTFTVSDICGNSVDVYQLIVIMDVDAPGFDVADLPELTGNCDITPSTATATDNCDGPLNGTPDVAFPITAPDTTIVTWTYTDACGNVSAQTQMVIITPIDVTTSMASDGITIVANNSGQSYQWIDCSTGQALAGETNHNFTPTFGGNFAVIVTENGCSDTSDCVSSSVGLNPIAIDLDLEINVFPNPTTNGNFSIQLIGDWNGEVKIEMVDIRGRLIYSKSTSEKILAVEIEDLASGTYFIKARDEKDNILTTRLVTVIE